MNPIIAFSGSSQTGKTTLARLLADHLNAKVLIFGDFVRDQAKNLGIENPTREMLQDLGHQMVKSDAQRFCSAALESARHRSGESLVVDGIRHLEILAAIQKLNPEQNVRLVYLSAPLEKRQERTHGNEDLTQVDSHPVEADTNEKLRAAADLVLDTSGDREQAFRRLLNWLSTTTTTQKSRS